MTTVRRIVCLANSRKLGARCVAGKELGTGVWVRPVGPREGLAIRLAEQRLPDGSIPAVLDVLEVPLLRATPAVHQPENWEIDSEHAWTRVDRLAMGDVASLQDRPLSLWGTGSSSASGLNDRIPATDPVDASLHLIRVEDLYLEVTGYRTRGQFTYSGAEYLFSVTDPTIEEAYAQTPGRHPVGAALLTVSLGEPFGSYCYKFIAAVIRRSSAE